MISGGLNPETLIKRTAVPCFYFLGEENIFKNK
jgi:hypothetical protein